MAFVVEDGTGLSNANSFCSVAYFRAYWADRGQVNITSGDATIQTWLVQATDYIVGRFTSFKGSPTYPDVQALPFPRDAWNTMPDALLQATCEYAMRVKTAPLAPDPVTDDSGRVVKRTSKQVGPLKKEIEYADNPIGYSGLKPYPTADMKMKPLLNGGGGRVIRA
jgi:hypothetical protein